MLDTKFILIHVYLTLAMKWRTDEHDPDLYDARMRDWYIKVGYPQTFEYPKEVLLKN